MLFFIWLDERHCCICIHRNEYILSLILTGSSTEEYDLVVIGGGSGGLACAKAGMKSSTMTYIPALYVPYISLQSFRPVDHIIQFKNNMEQV